MREPTIEEWKLAAQQLMWLLNEAMDDLREYQASNLLMEINRIPASIRHQIKDEPVEDWSKVIRRYH